MRKTGFCALVLVGMAASGCGGKSAKGTTTVVTVVDGAGRPFPGITVESAAAGDVLAQSVTDAFGRASVFLQRDTTVTAFGTDTTTNTNIAMSMTGLNPGDFVRILLPILQTDVPHDIPLQVTYPAGATNLVIHVGDCILGAAGLGITSTSYTGTFAATQECLQPGDESFTVWGTTDSNGGPVLSYAVAPQGTILGSSTFSPDLDLAAPATTPVPILLQNVPADVNAAQSTVTAFAARKSFPVGPPVTAAPLSGATYNGSADILDAPADALDLEVFLTRTSELDLVSIGSGYVGGAFSYDFANLPAAPDATLLSGGVQGVTVAGGSTADALLLIMRGTDANDPTVSLDWYVLARPTADAQQTVRLPPLGRGVADWTLNMTVTDVEFLDSPEVGDFLDIAEFFGAAPDVHTRTTSHKQVN